MLGPGEFIPLGEDSRLIVQLGLHVFEAVCRQLQIWLAAGGPANVPRVAVNVSARQLAIPDLADRLSAVAARYEVPSSKLEIEITESAMMVDPDEAKDVLMRLRDAGFRVSIDDFGTGYSSLAYLQTFPVDRLKIDKSFITRHPNDPKTNDGIVRTVIHLARHLQMDVVAEGVETVDQALNLRALECTYGQGYFFQRPAAAEVITPLLRGERQSAGIEALKSATQAA